MNKRAKYPPVRKYQSWQLKKLVRAIEFNLNDLTDKDFPHYSSEALKNRLGATKEMFDELSLRLD